MLYIKRFVSSLNYCRIENALLARGFLLSNDASNVHNGSLASYHHHENPLDHTINQTFVNTRDIAVTDIPCANIPGRYIAI